MVRFVRSSSVEIQFGGSGSLLAPPAHKVLNDLIFFRIRDITVPLVAVGVLRIVAMVTSQN